MFEKLEGIKLYGIADGIDLNKVMTLKKYASMCDGTTSVWDELLFYFKYSLFDDREYGYTFSDSSKFLLFYGKFNLRQDHQNIFLNFAKHFNDADCMYARKCKHIKCTPFRFLKRCLTAIIWIIQILWQKVPLVECLNALTYVGVCFDLNREASAVFAKKYAFVVVYYDCSPDDNYIIQVFRQRGIPTMTLQHGTFAQKQNPKGITDYGLELKESISDFFLAWNDYTRDEAVRIGVNPDKIKVLGVPKFIDRKEPEKPVKADNNLFGVILNFPTMDFHNRRLIDMANQIADKTGMRYIVRYHPRLKSAAYASCYGKGFEAENDNKTSIKEYAQQVSFSIITSSSVFIELLMLKHPTFRFRISDDDTYGSVEYNSFSTLEELASLLTKQDMDKQVFGYLCNNYNVYSTYRAFFGRFL